MKDSAQGEDRGPSVERMSGEFGTLIYKENKSKGQKCKSTSRKRGKTRFFFRFGKKRGFGDGPLAQIWVDKRIN